MCRISSLSTGIEHIERTRALFSFHQTHKNAEENVCFEAVNDYFVRCDIDIKRYLWNMGKEH